MHDNLIKLDTTFPDCTAIDTEAWLKAVLGEEIALGGEELARKMATNWLVEIEADILAAIEQETGVEYEAAALGNVFNGDNDFSDVFQFQVFRPADGTDWVYDDDVYIAVEVHQGGDVRGNYGRVRLYRADNLADTGFLDWVLGWDVTYSDGTEVPLNYRFDIGYSSHPLYEMLDHLKGGKLTWSEKRQCFVGVYTIDGRYVECRPYVNIS